MRPLIHMVNTCVSGKVYGFVKTIYMTNSGVRDRERDSLFERGVLGPSCKLTEPR